MPDGQLQLYRGGESILVDPTDYQARRALYDQKGWTNQKADPKTPFINFLQSSTGKAGPKGEPSFLDTINRELGAMGETMLGAAGSVKESFTQPPTEQEQKPFSQGGLGAPAQPGMLGKVGLAVGRNIGEPISTAAEWYKREAGLQKQNAQRGVGTLDKMLSVAPEGIGAGAATELMGEALKGLSSKAPEYLERAQKIAKPIVEKVSKISTGSHPEVLKELEDFRRTMKAKPTARQRDVANIKHRALQERTNKEWSNLYTNLKSEPTDALAIRRALQPLSEVDPVVKKWVGDNIKESETGESVSVPLWPKVRELSAQLNKDMANPKLDRVHKAEIPEAHAALESLLKESAKRQGMDKQYQQAYSLNRKMENIKFHTAYGTQAVKPSPLFGLGGAFAGIGMGESTGISGELGSAFIGKMIGEYLGKVVTKPGGKYTVPERSIAGERQVWKELGEKPPKGIGKKIVKPSADPMRSGGGQSTIQRLIKEETGSLQWGPGKPEQSSAVPSSATKEGVMDHNAAFQKAKSELPNGTLSDQLKRAQEILTGKR